MLLIVRHKMRHTTFAGMYISATEAFHVYVFIQHLFYHIRTGNKHIRCLVGHKNKIGKCR